MCRRVDNRIKVGLLGGGAMAQIHAASLCTSRLGQLVAVAADEVSEEVAALAKHAGATTMTVRALVEDSGIDALVIATPTDTHEELACYALKAGLDVFCEKPISRSVEEGVRIAEAAMANSGKVAVGHVVRYFPEYREAKEMIESGTLGRTAMVRLSRLNASPASVRPWYGEESRSGGALTDMGVHDIDWCLWALGPVERVFVRRAGEMGREVVSVMLRHREGTISYLDVSWRDRGFSTSLELCGTDAFYTVEGSSSAGLLVEHDAVGRASYLPKPALATLPFADDPYRLELEASLEWFGGGKPPLAVLGDGLEALRVVEAAERSVEDGHPVELGGIRQ